MTDRKAICKTANHLVSTGLNRCEAFKAAWLMDKRGGIAKVAGVTHDNRQRLIERLSAYSHYKITISLQRDKANIFDTNAIAVIASVQGKGSAIVGYIQAMTAFKLAMLIDKGIKLKAMLAGIVGGCGLTYGLRVKVAI